MERMHVISRIHKLYDSGRNEPNYITHLSVKDLLHIFDYLSSNQVAICREVCQKFDAIGKKVLNKRFRYFSKTIPETLRAVANTNKPEEIDRQCQLFLINSGLISLKAVFGHYVVTRKCCFYPGKILDSLDVLLKKTQKRCHYHLSIRIKNYTRYSCSLRKFFYLIDKASNHFENKIEPFLPPPKVSIRTKIMDLLTSYCDIQRETNTDTYRGRINSRFPGELPVPSVRQMRKEILMANLKWVEENVRRRTIKVCGTNLFPDAMNKDVAVASSSNDFNQTMDIEEEDVEDQLEEFVCKNKLNENETSSEIETKVDRTNSFSTSHTSIGLSVQREIVQTENYTSISENSQTLENFIDVEMTETLVEITEIVTICNCDTDSRKSSNQK